MGSCARLRGFMVREGSSDCASQSSDANSTILALTRTFQDGQNNYNSRCSCASCYFGRLDEIRRRLRANCPAIATGTLCDQCNHTYTRATGDQHPDSVALPTYHFRAFTVVPQPIEVYDTCAPKHHGMPHGPRGGRPSGAPDEQARALIERWHL